MSGITVYSYRRCPFAIRVRLTLHEKGLNFVTVEEKLRDFSPELLEMHPEAKVPVLVHGENVIYESAIITEYLEDAFPSPSLMPKDPTSRMKIRLWTYWCNHIFKKDLDDFKYGREKLSEEAWNTAKQNLTQHLEKLENQIKKTGWVEGNNFSLGDIHLFPFYRQLSRVEPQHPELKKFDVLTQWFDKICSRDTFEKTMAKVKKVPC